MGKSRFSACKGDLGEVFCDGIALECVHEVDTELGFAVVSDLDENGKVIIADGQIALRLVTGNMQFLPKLGAK